MIHFTTDTFSFRRILSFRFWDFDMKKMEYDVENLQYFSALAKTRTIETMQYIGIDDIHGKKIYEGDIVVHHPADGTKSRTAVIRYERTRGSFSFGRNGEMQSVAQYEVIGNVFEDPGLLIHLSEELSY